MDERIVILSPHPDDFDAIAVTLRQFHERGSRIDLAVVTSGASGVEDFFSGTPDPAVKAASARKNSARAAGFSGCQTTG